VPSSASWHDSSTADWTVTRVGAQKHCQANPKSPLFRELCGIARKTVGLADVLREALTPLASEIDLAFVFGSVAQGKERVTSDVDVFVVGSVSFTDVVKSVAARKVLRVRRGPAVYSRGFPGKKRTQPLSGLSRPDSDGVTSKTAFPLRGVSR